MNKIELIPAKQAKKTAKLFNQKIVNTMTPKYIGIVSERITRYASQGKLEVYTRLWKGVDKNEFAQFFIDKGYKVTWSANYIDNVTISWE